MTVFTAKQFEDGRPPIAPEHSGYTVARYAEVTVPNTLALNDIVRLVKVPAKSVITGAWIQCAAIDTDSALRLRLGIEKWPTDTHIIVMTVTAAASATKTAVITLNGDDNNVSLNDTDHDTTTKVAAAIVAVVDALDGYAASNSGAVITITGTEGTPLTVEWDANDSGATASIAGAENIVANSELTAAAYPVDGSIAHMTSFPAAILQDADNLLTERRIVAKVTVEGTTRVEGKIRACVFYRAVDFGL